MLSEVLQAIHFRSAIFRRSELTSWGFSVSCRDFATFHIVLKGRCCLEVNSVDGLTWLSAGDLVILPHGSAHTVRDSPVSRATRLEDLIVLGKTDHRGILRAGGSGLKTALVCGGFNPVLTALPPIIHLRGRRRRVEVWLQTTSIS